MIAVVLVIGLLMANVTLSANPAHATRYWVATTGSDANPCNTVDGDDDPGVYRATPAGGTACLSGGDTLTIKSGTYTGSTAHIRNLPAGTAGNPTIVEGDPSSQAYCAINSNCPTLFQPTTNNTKIEVSHVLIRKIRIDHQNLKSLAVIDVVIASPASITDITVEDIEAYGTRIDSPTTCGAGGGFGANAPTSFVTLRRVHAHDLGNFYAANPCMHGAYMQGDDILVEYSLFHDNANSGMQCYSSASTSDGRSDRCTVRYSVFRDNTAAGLIIEGHDGRVHNNLIYGNGAGLLLGYGGTAGTIAFNNTIYGNTGPGVQLRSGSSSTTVKNNIIVGNDLACEVVSGLTGIVTTHNAYGSGTSCGSTGKVTVAALTDILISTTDFRVKSGSTVIDAGTAISGYPYNGSAPDIGAYESIPNPTGTITGSTATLTFPMNVDVPILVPSGSPVTIACTGSACPGSPTVSTAARETSTDTKVNVGISGIAGNACVLANQSWTLSHNGSTSTGWTSGSDIGGNGVRQHVFSFSNLALTNQCTGAGTAEYPAGYHFYYKFDDGAGTNANDESANNLDCTLTNGPTWGSGKNGGALVVAPGTTAYCAIPWGSGVNPSTQSMTWVIAVNIALNTESSIHYLGGPDLGTNQRAYICASGGTWRLAVQSVTCSSAGASNLAVSPGWNFLVVRWDSASDVATLSKNGVTGTGGATHAYTSFTFSTNYKVGKLDTNNTTGETYDDMLVYLSLQDPAVLYASFQAASTSATGTFGMPSYQFEAVYLTQIGGAPTIFGTGINQPKDVVERGAVVVALEWYCQTGADCPLTSVRLAERHTNTLPFTGAEALVQVPDTETDTHVYMWGADANVLLNSGPTTSRLSANSCTVTNGVTLLTSAQVPAVDLPEGGCTVHKYIVRLGANAYKYYEFELVEQNGTEFTGTVNPARINVIAPQANAGP